MSALAVEALLAELPLELEQSFAEYKRASEPPHAGAAADVERAPNDAAVITVRSADGILHEDVSVHGVGGAIATAYGHVRFKELIRLANEHKTLHVYEPRPGFVWAYKLTAAGITGGWEVDLRGAELVAWR